MAANMDIPAWIAFFIGLYALAGGAGELRVNGLYLDILSELEHSPALRFVTGVVCLSLGAAIYLSNPWNLDDPLAMVVTIMGGLIAAEGGALIAVGDRFMALARRIVGVKGEFWAWVSTALGAVLVMIALSRIA
ncbi:hypothetical protein FHS61_001361 [Altererythrobacter atlanticus]|uniref:Uncharacterized protein n=1 Tax=Croceibacterium atlanticum TaxID=1267766 RepID=A0A0F7KYZ3_9SPHN|nr:hypothetical protein [Croceibacterium atlanticum]AKH44045.1 hypothetical protein WYH_03025 [Croceibacterium atlanticum]MBB5732352.1 hypothetical protein [Croceibacterium atlanticum]